MSVRDNEQQRFATYVAIDTKTGEKRSIVCNAQCDACRSACCKKCRDLRESEKHSDDVSLPKKKQKAIACKRCDALRERSCTHSAAKMFAMKRENDSFFGRKTKYDIKQVSARVKYISTGKLLRDSQSFNAQQKELESSRCEITQKTPNSPEIKL